MIILEIYGYRGERIKQKNRWAAIGVFIVIIIIICSIFLFSLSPSESYTDRYYIKVTNSDSGNYTVRLPIPTYQNNTTIFKTENVRIISGNVTFKVIESSHGLVLEISSGGNFELEMMKIWEGNYQFSNLTTIESIPVNDTKYGGHEPDCSAWIYSYKSNPNSFLSIFLEYKHKKISGSSVVETIDIRMENGWNLVNVYDIPIAMPSAFSMAQSYKIKESP